MTDTLIATPDTDDIEAEVTPQGFDLVAAIQSPNLAFDLDADVLARIGDKVVEEYEMDDQSREDAGWNQRIKEAVDLAMQVKGDKTFPWPDAANIKYPLVTTASIQFAARAYPAIVDGWNVVKGKVLGAPTPDKQARADRIGQHMSWQLLEQMGEWESDTDKLLHMLPVVGVMIRKAWYDPVLGHNRTELIPPQDFVVNYRSREDWTRATQVIHVPPHECLERFRTGLWRECPLEIKEDSAEPECFLEQHRLWDMDGDGYPEPWIITVHKETGNVVRIVARFEEEGVVTYQGEIVRIEPVQYFTKYSFIPSLDGSWYDVGFGTLLQSLNETINATVNQLLDAGTLANTQGGFISESVKIRSGNATFKPGEWKKASAQGGLLRDSIVPLPVNQPSAVLFSLLGMMVEAAKDITATKDILTGAAGETNQPVGTTLAMIEQGLKVFSAIYKRIHRALKNELGILYRLNATYMQDEDYFTFHDAQGVAARQDYELGGLDVVPVSDPTVVTDMQRMGRAQFLIATFRGDPMVDQRELDRRVMEAAGIPDIDTLMPEPEGPPPPPPELVKALADAENQKRQTDIKAAESGAKVAKDLADAERTTLETLLASPALFELVRQIVRDNDAGAVQGMGDIPPDPAGAGGFAPPAEQMGPGMGAGFGPVPPDPGQGQDIRGAFGPV